MDPAARIRLRRPIRPARRLAWAVAGFALIACDSWVPLEPGLAGRAASAPAASACASCHAYPVGGVNHQFHLLHADSLKAGNGPITCLDCHAGSIRSYDQVILDTIYANSRGTSASAYDSAASRTFRAALAAGKYVLVRVDTLVHHRPVPLPAEPGRVALLQEWMTGVDHLNGRVDVKFDPRDDDPARYGSRSAVYDPVQETCSAVACHLHATPYRWPAPSKGLSGLNANPK